MKQGSMILIRRRWFPRCYACKIQGIEFRAQSSDQLKALIWERGCYACLA